MAFNVSCEVQASHEWQPIVVDLDFNFNLCFTLSLGTPGITLSPGTLITFLHYFEIGVHVALFVFSIGGPKQIVKSFLTPVSESVFMLFHMAALVLLAMVASLERP